MTTFKKHSRKPVSLPALAMIAALGLGTAAHAATYNVTVGSDDGTGTTANTLSWAIRQANLHPGKDIITLKTNVVLTGVMKTLIDGTPSGGDHDNGGGGVLIESDSTRRSISGDNQFRPLFVKSGPVVIKNLDLIDGKAKGGDSLRGGGGAGLGGALFVYSGSVGVENVAFSTNNASGGSGAVTGLSRSGAGMLGNSEHRGGGSLFESSTSNDGAYGGTGHYGGFGGTGNGGAGGFGGGGAYGYYVSGGAGGFGGGGGYGYYGKGGSGGFGGGGGYGYYSDGGAGGFGGGGAGGYYSGGGTSYGGGAGAGNHGTGGGGAGFGGAIFAMNGTVTLTDVSFSSNTITAGTGANDGTALAADIYICTDQDTLCGAIANACGTTATTEIMGTFGSDCSPIDLGQEKHSLQTVYKLLL